MSENEIGNYYISKERIGRGAFSIIYKGHTKYTNTVVAIKELNYDTNKKMMENIKNEFDIMKKLKHENIVTLHDIYYDKLNKNIYLVLDYYKRGDLNKFLAKKPLKETYARTYMNQLSSGLKYLIDNNILHRDLKPQNILVSDSYILKITDFGFARYFDKDIIIQTLCGSPMYMAPEIMKYKKYNNKSDLWSVGVIMYEMLFGEVPFRAKNFIDLIKCINKKKILIPSKFIISDNCSYLLFKLLEKDPEKRIEWNDFFNSKWLLEEDPINKLLDFSMSDNSPLPILNKPLLMSDSYNQFHSFKHRSIRDISQEMESEIDIFGNKQILVSLNSSNEKSDSDSDESFVSLDDTGNEPDHDHNCEYDKSTTLPIDIINRRINGETVFVTHDMIDDKYRPISDPSHNKSLSKSFKEYLYSSFIMIKQSINYIKTI